MPRPVSRINRLVPVLATAALVLAAAPGAVASPEPPAASPAASPATNGGYEAVLAGLHRTEAAQEKATRKARYDAIAAWVRANASAAHVESAREALVDLAGELGDPALVLKHADEFLAAHATSDAALGVRLSRAAALGDLGRLDDAKKVYEEIAGGLAGDVRNQFGVVAMHAALLADFGQPGAAKAVLTKFREENKDNEDAVRAADRQIGSFEALGKEPTAFPAGLLDLDGKPVALSDFKGKLLFIDFWATWCGPCVAEVPHVVEAYERFHDRGFEVLGVTLDGPEDAAKVRLFAAERGMPWRQQHDSAKDKEGNALAEAYGVQGIPHTILVGRDGKVLRTNLRGDALEHAVARALARDKVASAPAATPAK